jgi:hypothetical protein
VFETLKELAKLAVPAVREEVLGIKPQAGEKAGDEQFVQDVVNEVTRKESEAEYDRSPEEEAHLRRMKLKTLEEIEGELDKLSHEFLDKSKKSRPS